MVPFNRGIATPVCALACNDSVYSTNTNLRDGWAENRRGLWGRGDLKWIIRLPWRRR